MEEKDQNKILAAIIFCTLFLSALIVFQDKQELNESLATIEQLKQENRQLKDTVGYRDKQISSMFDERAKLKEKIQTLENSK